MTISTNEEDYDYVVKSLSQTSTCAMIEESLDHWNESNISMLIQRHASFFRRDIFVSNYNEANQKQQLSLISSIFINLNRTGRTLNQVQFLFNRERKKIAEALETKNIIEEKISLIPPKTIHTSFDEAKIPLHNKINCENYDPNFNEYCLERYKKNLNSAEERSNICTFLDCDQNCGIKYQQSYFLLCSSKAVKSIWIEKIIKLFSWLINNKKEGNINTILFRLDSAYVNRLVSNLYLLRSKQEITYDILFCIAEFFLEDLMIQIFGSRNCRNQKIIFLTQNDQDQRDNQPKHNLENISPYKELYLLSSLLNPISTIRIPRNNICWKYIFSSEETREPFLYFLEHGILNKSKTSDFICNVLDPIKYVNETRTYYDIFFHSNRLNIILDGFLKGSILDMIKNASFLKQFNLNIALDYLNDSKRVIKKIEFKISATRINYKKYKKILNEELILKGKENILMRWKDELLNNNHEFEGNANHPNIKNINCLIIKINQDINDSNIEKQIEEIISGFQEDTIGIILLFDIIDNFDFSFEFFDSKKGIPDDVGEVERIIKLKKQIEEIRKGRISVINNYEYQNKNAYEWEWDIFYFPIKVIFSNNESFLVSFNKNIKKTRVWNPRDFWNKIDPNNDPSKIWLELYSVFPNYNVDVSGTITPRWTEHYPENFEPNYRFNNLFELICNIRGNSWIRGRNKRHRDHFIWYIMWIKDKLNYESLSISEHENYKIYDEFYNKVISNASPDRIVIDYERWVNRLFSLLFLTNKGIIHDISFDIEEALNKFPVLVDNMHPLDLLKQNFRIAANFQDRFINATDCTINTYDHLRYIVDFFFIIRACFDDVGGRFCNHFYMDSGGAIEMQDSEEDVLHKNKIYREDFAKLISRKIFICPFNNILHVKRKRNIKKIISYFNERNWEYRLPLSLEENYNFFSSELCLEIRFQIYTNCYPFKPESSKLSNFLLMKNSLEENKNSNKYLEGKRSESESENIKKFMKTEEAYAKKLAEAEREISEERKKAKELLEELQKTYVEIKEQNIQKEQAFEELEKIKDSTKQALRKKDEEHGTFKKKENEKLQKERRLAMLEYYELKSEFDKYKTKTVWLLSGVAIAFCLSIAFAIKFWWKKNGKTKKA